jgi:hypothetical protein
MYARDWLEIVYELRLLPNNTAGETCLHKTVSGLKFLLDIYNWSIGLAVAGRIRDIGQSLFTAFSNRK